MIVALAVLLLENAITYHCPAQSAGTVLNELSALSGQTLEASPEMQKEILLIDVQDQPWDTLKSQIATASTGVWVAEGPKWVLKPDGGARSRQDKEEAQQRSQAIRDKIHDWLDVADKLKAEDQTLPAGKVQGPTYLASVQLFSRLDPDEVAAVADGDGKVWATNDATALEAPFPSDPNDVFSDWQAERIRLAALDPQSFPVPSHPLAKGLVSVRRVRQGIIGHIQIFDTQGTQVVDNFEGMSEEGLEAKVPENPSAPRPTNGFVFSPKSAECANNFARRVDPYVLPVASPSLRWKLNDFTRFDPLNYLVADYLDYYARCSNKQLVADIPDSLSARIAKAYRDNPEPDAAVPGAFGAIEYGHDVQVQSDGDVMVLKPTHPATARAERLDRKVFHRLMQDPANSGCPTLDDLCAYAADHPPVYNSPFAWLFAPGLLQMGYPMDQEGCWTALRFISTFDSVDGFFGQPQNDWITLDEGSRRQLAWAIATVYGSHETSFAPLNHLDYAESVRGIMTNFIESEPQALQNQPTEALAATSKCHLLSVSLAEPTLFFDAGYFYPAVIEPELFANLAKKTGSQRGLSMPTRAMFGSRRSARIQIAIGDHAAYWLDMADSFLPPGQKPSPVSEAPDEFKTRVAGFISRLPEPTGTAPQAKP